MDNTGAALGRRVSMQHSNFQDSILKHFIHLCFTKTKRYDMIYSKNETILKI